MIENLNIPLISKLTKPICDYKTELFLPEVKFINLNIHSIIRSPHEYMEFLQQIERKINLIDNQGWITICKWLLGWHQKVEDSNVKDNIIIFLRKVLFEINTIKIVNKEIK
jgi:hypothetical protein